jgi:hypothetical protein
MCPDPVSNILNIDLPKNMEVAVVEGHNITGSQVNSKRAKGLSVRSN